MKRQKNETVRQQGGLHAPAEEPSDDRTAGETLGRAALVCSAVTAALGILGILGWVSRLHVLAGVRVDYIPIAPSTAVAFILLAGALFLRARAPSRRFGKVGGMAAALLVSLLSFLILLDFVPGVHLEIEKFLLREPGTFGAVRTGRMSPITAANFLLAALAMLLLAPARRAPAGGAAGLASIVVAVSLVVLLGYVYGTPLLYGGKIIPVALPTAIAFLFLGLGLIAAAGPDHFPLRPFLGPSARALLLRAFLPVTAATVLASGLLYHSIPFHVEVNRALLAALLASTSAVVVSVVVSQTARVIGGAMDRAGSERARAEETLRRAYDGLEMRVRERTAELAKANDALQADVAERKRVEEALAEERNILRTLIDNLPDRIYVKDTQGRYVIDNIAHLRSVGATAPDEVIGKTVFDFFPPELAAQYSADDQAVIESGRPWVDREEPIVDPAGNRKWLSTTKMPLQDTHGKIAGLVCLSRDITEHKQAEEALRDSEVLYHSLVDGLPLNVFRKDLEGRFTFANKLFCDTLGARLDEIIGKTDFDLFPPELAEKYRQADRRVIEDGEVFETVEEHRRSDGQKISVEVTHTRVYASRGGSSGRKQSSGTSPRASRRKQSATGQGSRRSRHPRQERVSGQHEPRDPHAHERHPRRGGAASIPRSPTAGVPGHG